MENNKILTYVAEANYKARNFEPFKQALWDLCGNCKEYYKGLYDSLVTDKPFPPRCKGHVLERVKGLSLEDFRDMEEYNSTTTLLDPITWAKSEFDWEPRWYQDHMISCSSQMKLYRLGRRSGKCLIKGTKVATPKGPVNIEDLSIGDLVYDEFGKEIKVLNTFDQGLQEVVDLTNHGKTIATCTLDHPWLTTFSGKEKVRKTKDIKRDVKIKRIEINSPLGSIENPTAYVLGAMLGDGSCRECGLIISTADESIVSKMAGILNTTYKKSKGNNYSWYLPNTNKTKIQNYDWCDNKYAHEKVVDLDIIRSWNRYSLLEFVAGIIDTDGSVIFSGKEVTIAVFMQAKPVIEALRYAFLALWQINLTLLLDNRAKYKNGPLYGISLKNIYQSKRVLKELDSHLTVTRKKYKQEYDLLVPNNFNPEGVGACLENPRIEHCYDIHVDSSTNLYLLANGLVTHNTEAMVVETLHEIFTSKDITVLMIAPFERQVTRFFDEISKFIKNSATLRSSISRFIRNPSRIELVNGSKILGFSSAATGASRSDKIRGQDGHLIIIDEMDYLLDSDIDAIMAILSSRPETRIIASSTPKGWRRKFYNYSVDKNLGFKEFWFISAESPSWTAEIEDFYARSCGGKNSATYKHEYLADFAEQEEGVFKADHLNKSIERYDMDTEQPQEGVPYILGVDWNKNAGVHMVILDWASAKLKMVKKIIVPESEYTQTQAVDEIIRLNSVWKFKYIFVDEGYGSTQCEMLRKYGRENRASAIDKKLHPMAMNKHLVVHDPITGQEIKKPTKAFLVQQTAKILEDGMLTLPASEDTVVVGDISTMGVIQQMRNYRVENFSIYGLPRYSQGQDHTLTALILACGGYALKEGDLKKLPYAQRVGSIQVNINPLTEQNAGSTSATIDEYLQGTREGLTLIKTNNPEMNRSQENYIRDLDYNKSLFLPKTSRNNESLRKNIQGKYKRNNSEGEGFTRSNI